MWRDETTLIGVSCVISADGCNLWSWNIETGDVTTLLSDLEDNAIGALRYAELALHPNQNWLAITDSNNRIHLVDTRSGYVFQTIEQVDESDPIRAIAWNANGIRLVVATGTTINIWQNQSR